MHDGEVLSAVWTEADVSAEGQLAIAEGAEVTFGNGDGLGGAARAGLEWRSGAG